MEKALNYFKNQQPYLEGFLSDPFVPKARLPQRTCTPWRRLREHMGRIFIPIPNTFSKNCQACWKGRTGRITEIRKRWMRSCHSLLNTGNMNRENGNSGRRSWRKKLFSLQKITGYQRIITILPGVLIRSDGA